MDATGAKADIQSNYVSVMPDIIYQAPYPLGSYFQIWKFVSQEPISTLCCSLRIIQF